ncbi:mandelate racemase/muconate lactonizing enzyme family protein [Zobellia barbeyronii]|uniref:Mandelate racemase/muconate lactonizing enzyme family protein n=1 Tax=Zobellia barbeyronii TaxID=2748009 RepID=A0ABS5WGS1_9FLAO|nr:mandelate racemase/muconate lactonizing enzyme family protein [Zobellia barbeyronii]MBT2161407.1 mandelate racemase/muconate lactonizing enzyme family protein [Zobellia barbeyronii]
MSQEDKIVNVEVYLVSLDQETPYLGPLINEEKASEMGYFVREVNRTVYAIKNKSLVVRVLTENGVEGWGETYGLIAHEATAAIIRDLFKGFIIGRNPMNVVTIYEDLYDLMRVRGYTGGFYHDALAAVDIALWDILGKIVKQPISRLLGGIRNSSIPGYISGLPDADIDKRCQLAVSWQKKGFNSFKFALPMATEGLVEEFKQLRKALGNEASIGCDMHWSKTPGETIELIQEAQPYRPWFFEAPIKTEDVNGLKWIAQKSNGKIAVGEEWRTVFDAKARIDIQACQIVQPEMAHTGITQFMRIAGYAQAHNLTVIPHATIGSGIFLAASLQASASLQNCVAHEFQHSIFPEFMHYTTGDMKCEAGHYQLPTGNGIGVNPTEEMKSNMTLL